MNQPIPSTPNEHDVVVRHICDSYQNRFKVLNNIDGPKNFVAGLFPDILLQDTNTGSLLFIIEVKRNGNISQCIQQWKSIPKIPAVLYIIVPENDLISAKSVAQVVGLQVKIGTYKMGADGRVSVNYDA